MRRRHRYLNRQYGGYETQPKLRRKIMGIAILALALFLLGKWTFAYFGVGNEIHRHGTLLTMERLNSVQVSIEGGELRQAENEQKLFPNDRITTGMSGRAMLTFFDGSAVYLNELSDLTIEESFSGEKESVLSLFLREGSIWLSAPVRESFSGSIVRTVATPKMEVSLPPGTESVITPGSIVVFAAEGIGTTIRTERGLIPVIVGEGQKLVLPSDLSPNDDLYAFRSPLDPTAIQSPFIQESRALYAGRATVTPGEESLSSEPELAPEEQDETLVVLAPENDTLLTSSTVEVQGKVGKDITRVRVNGYNAPIDRGNGTFSLELALPDEDEGEIVIVALSEEDTAVSEVRRKVLRAREPPPPPSIVSPASAGQTYRTSSERFTIEGKASPDTVGIVVNDYRLQLYEPGKTTWSYLASTNINNLRPGKNTYAVVAINRGGYRSDPAILTILLEPGPEGVVGEGGEESAAPITEENSEEETAPPAPAPTLPSNSPLMPGSLKVIGPAPEAFLNATGSSFLIEGTTAPETDSLWVNDYRLRLYEPGKTTWNYIADTDLGTLHRGRNVYAIITRDSRGRILDELQYVVEFRPGSN